ncbi:MAG: hypothetical protein K2N23_01360, partial [Clostridia bacterium]|nr:hypothetical protein [Clostridia bacterium]
GMTLLLFSALILLMLFTGSSVFAGIGKAICTFMYGTFGYGSLLIVGLIAYLGEWLIFGKKIKVSFKTALLISLTALSAFLLFHAATSRNITLESYGRYISGCYSNAAKGFSGYTFGGVISAIIVYPIAKIATFVGAYVIFSLLVIISGYFLFVNFKNRRRMPKGYSNAIRSDDTRNLAEYEAVNEKATVGETVTPVQQTAAPIIKVDVRTRAQAEEDNNPYSQKNLGRKILFAKGEFDAESYKRNMIFNEKSYFNRPQTSEQDYLSNFYSGKSSSIPKQSYGTSYQEDVLNQPVSSAPSHYVYGDKPVDKLNDYEQVSGGTFPTQNSDSVLERKVSEINHSEPVVAREEKPAKPEPIITDNAYKVENVRKEEPRVEIEPPISDLRNRSVDEPSVNEMRNRSADEPQESDTNDEPISMYKLFGSSPRGENRVEPDISRLSSRRQELSNANLFDDDKDDDDDFSELDQEEPRATGRISMDEIKLPEERRSIREVSVSRTPQPIQNEEKAVQEEKPKHVWKKYIRPGLDLLDDYPEHSNVNAAEIEDNKTTIVETLLRFKIESEVANVIIGPAVTRYDVVIADKTKTMQSVKYKEAIAMALMKDNVTAYLNFSKGALSIEVPNNTRTIVGLKSMLASPKFINCKPNSITFALGKNVEGEAVCSDITKMPHLLIAGTTGSGKSICLSALIISLLYKYGPEELRFILVDPKQVEFISYDKLPHLMINEIIYEVDKAIKALNWAIKEMERRYSLFKEMTEKGIATKNLDEYNAHLPEGEERLPKIVIILDEFGDLMLQAKKDIEGRIIKLVQKARACGIHLILATQRPSVDCITGLIKSNLPTRIGFKVNSFDDARTIFDIGGAEKLLGKGDMYFRSAESPDLARIQGCFIDTHEVQRVTDFVKAHNETYFDQSVSDFINTVEVEETSSSMSGDENSGDGADIKIDDTYIKALHYCVTSNQASVSMIQRRFPVGYIKACKIIDWMENMNYVTQSEGSKPRKVLLSKEEFLNTYGEVDD